MKKKLTYKDSGVDILGANRFVDSIAGLAKQTQGSGVIDRKGSFGALFGLSRKYKTPVLVSSTDGVGTKLLLANHLGKHDTVGIDLVAMNVNDILCTGATPLFFLDYIACGKLNQSVLKDVVKGVAKGCELAECALIGGETAEMPDMYQGEDYDLAGFAVGVVEQRKLIDGSQIRSGDVVIGLPSSGFHSNGYSLVRKAFSPQDQKKYAKELLAPTKIYTKEILPLLEKFLVRGIAHITGGAFYEKLTKVLPEGLAFEINRASWPKPKVYSLLQERIEVDYKELYRTFNMGIGMALVVRKADAQLIMAHFKRRKITAYEIGCVVKNADTKITFVEEEK